MVMLSKANEYLTSKMVKTGEIIKFLDEGQWVENTKYLKPDGSPSNSFMMGCEYKGEKKQVKITVNSRESIAPVWGYDTKSWIGKNVSITVVPVPQGGKFSIWLQPVLGREDLDPKDIQWKE